MRIPAPLQPYDPERIGRYQVLGRIGAGAMGQVYLARSPGSRLVAVKTIRAELAADDEFRRRFAHEVTAARRVGGAFTAPVVDADPDADLPWLATVYLPVPSLAALIDHCGPLPVPAVRWLAAGCAEALECIHRAGLVHRDLKPANVLVALDGPRVIDFGLVRAEGLSHLTAIGDAMGTPSFMAPEQASGEGPIGPAVDVFSLGATLVFAASGGSAYRGSNGIDAIYQMIHGEPDLSDVPEALRPILAACLARDPADRPTPAALMEYHAPFLSGPAVSPPLPTVALRLIADYGRKLTEEYGRTPNTEVGEATRDDAADGARGMVGGLVDEWERELDRFLDQGPIHPGAAVDGLSPDDPTSHARAGLAAPTGRLDRGRRRGRAGQGKRRDPDSAKSRDREQDENQDKSLDEDHGHRRRTSLRATLAVALAAGVAGGLGYSLHFTTTTQIAQAASTGASADSTAAARAAAAAVSESASGAGSSPAPRLPAVKSSPTMLGFVGQPPGMPPPPSQAIWQDEAGAVVAVNPPYGDQATGFILHGSGWQPGEKLTVSIVGGRTVPNAIVADSLGGFDYLLNARDRFFSGPIPPGTYRVHVKAGSVVATITFSVNAGTNMPGPPGP